VHFIDDDAGTFIEDRRIITELVHVSAPEPLGRELDGGERILHFMRDPARNLPPCSHALHSLELGKIVEYEDHAYPFVIVTIEHRGLAQQRQPLPAYGHGKLL